jgi:hypothetical protein
MQQWLEKYKQIGAKERAGEFFEDMFAKKKDEKILVCLRIEERSEKARWKRPCLNQLIRFYYDFSFHHMYVPF